MKHPPKPQISILFFLISFANVLGVLYTATLPDLTKYFQVTKAQVQETISFYLIGCLLGQLIYAPIANALGRKPAIFIGCCLALFGSFLCLISIELGSFTMLLFGRVMTAFGAACGLILTNTLIADSFTYNESKKILSYLMSGFAVFPAISITIGGFITEYISWKGCFYFISLYSVFVIGLCIFLPETAKQKNLGHLKVPKIIKSYHKQLQNILFLFYALIVACASIILYVFSAEAPFIAKNQLHISSDAFGLYNLIPNIGLFLGGFAAVHLSHKFSSKTLLLIGGCCFSSFSILMWILFKIEILNILTLFGIPLFIFFVVPTILSNGQVCALAISKEKPYASSLMYVIQYFLMFSSIFVLKAFSPQDISALPFIYSLAGILMILLWIVIQNYSKTNRSQKISDTAIL